MDSMLFTKLLMLLSPEKRLKTTGYFKKEDQLRSLFAELLARFMIQQETGIEAASVRFSYNHYGKPQIANQRGLYVNWTHAGEWVACALADVEVGIDVEKIQCVEQSLVNRCLSKSELAEYERKVDKEKNEYFIKQWTLKESYVKWDSRGIVIPFRSITFEEDDINHFSLTIRNGDGETQCFLRSESLSDHYKLAFCSTIADPPAQILVLQHDELISKL
ncbi:4'-phosphopantetheinyl transferase superfamily protein [Paenibacillus cellulosilyticus]|nr:4'-phosphopantetheinyl transferase superfamily protein [Paenibacillus cellulosilyticus]